MTFCGPAPPPGPGPGGGPAPGPGVAKSRVSVTPAGPAPERGCRALQSASESDSRPGPRQPPGLRGRRAVKVPDSEPIAGDPAAPARGGPGGRATSQSESALERDRGPRRHWGRLRRRRWADRAPGRQRDSLALAGPLQTHARPPGPGPTAGPGAIGPPRAGLTSRISDHPESWVTAILHPNLPVTYHTFAI